MKTGELTYNATVECKIRFLKDKDKYITLVMLEATKPMPELGIYSVLKEFAEDNIKNLENNTDFRINKVETIKNEGIVN